MRLVTMIHAKVFAVAASTLAAVALTGSAGAETQAPRGAVAAQEAGRNGLPEDFRIGPEDVLQISVWKNDALSRTVPVRPDGKISLPLLNDVHVAGLTPLELQAVLVKQFAEYLPAPEVTVIVTEVRSVKFSVIGEVARPGRYEVKSRITVLDAIALAGGFTMFASRSQITILRPEGGTIKRIRFNLNKLVADGVLTAAGGSAEDGVYLRPGDTIFVP
jgi:polysaccharide export outer membrane protein